MHDLMEQARSAALTEAPPMRRDVDDVVAAGRRSQVRHRLLKTGGAATAAAVAVAVAVTLPQAFAGQGTVTAGASGAASAPATVPATALPSAAAADPATADTAAAPGLAYPAAKFSYGFRGYTTGPFTITGPILVTPGYQELYVRRGNAVDDLYDGSQNDKVVASSPRMSALVTVFRPGVFQPSRFADGQSVQVKGRPGRYAPDVHYQPGDDSPSHGALAWQYADNAWAVVAAVTPDGFTKAEFLQIASGLAAAPAAPATVPVKLTWAPAGYVLTSVGATDDYPNGATYMTSSLRLIKTRPSYTDLKATVDASATGSPTLRVAVYPIEFTDSTHQKPGPASCNAGNANLCYKMTADGKYLVEIDTNGGLSTSDLRKVLDSAQLANPADRGTWFPITQAAPGATG
ncbi:hypothetical protein [Dactylosporangium sp. CA-092794]|uniref:hypothetical protein n=1 Tax=Dactylosporangium sp. CA-092794 TaxID=3239929 RepID=UPI003D90A5AB